MLDKQKMLLDFIKKFNKICADNDIEYFVGCGSALGAVRHKGFLPWDDDIDLIMKRDEYQRAKPIFKKVFPENWMIVDNDEFPEYNNPIVRITDINATEYLRSRLIDGSPKGSQLEIFILDPIPASEINQGQYYKDFFLYCEAKTNNFLIANRALNMENFPLEQYNNCKTQEDRKALTDELEKKLFSYSEEECEYYHFRWGIEWICYPKETFAKQHWVEFEDVVLPIASGFATEFFTDYGDTWMMIPDVEDQWVHPTLENYNVSYKEYEKLLNEAIDYKKTKESRAQQKPTNVVKYYNDDIVRRLYLHHDNVRIAMKYAKGEGMREAALLAAENRNYSAAEKALAEFVAQQEKNFERYMLATDDMELLEAALEVCFVRGNWRFVEKTRKIIVNKPELITEKMNKIFEIISRAREAYFSQYYDRHSEYRDTVQDVLAEYPQQVNMIEMKHLIDCFDENSDKAACLDALENLSAELKERPVIIMLKVYCLQQTGRSEEAKAIYDSFRETSNHGMVLIKLKEIMGY